MAEADTGRMLSCPVLGYALRQTFEHLNQTTSMIDRRRLALELRAHPKTSGNSDQLFKIPGGGF
jgi:hypothetical protein